MFCEQAYVASPDYAALWAHLGRGELDAGEYLRLGAVAWCVDSGVPQP